MGIAVLPSQYTLKPQEAVGPHRSSPLTRELESLWTFGEGGGRLLHDAAGLHPISVPGSGWAPSPLGVAMDFPAAGTGQRATRAYIAPPFSLLAVFRKDGDGCLFSHNTASTNDGYRMQIFGGNFDLIFGGVAIYGLGTPTTGLWYTGIITCNANGGTATGYLAPLNGGSLTVTTAAVGTIVGTPNRIEIGAHTGSGAQFDGAIALGAWWRRVVIDHEARLLVRDPLRLLQTPPPRLLLDAPAAAAAAATRHYMYYQRLRAG